MPLGPSLIELNNIWMQGLSRIGGLYDLAALAQAGKLDAYYSGLLKAIDAERAAAAAPFAASAGAGAIVAGTLPVVTMVGVWVALGSGYYQARNEVRNENAASGFSQGWVAALLGWEYDHALARFGRPVVEINVADEATDEIRADAYNDGLQKGFLAGKMMPSASKKAYLTQLRQLSGVKMPSADQWVGNRNLQISYVISLASAARRYNVIRAE